MSAIGKWNPLFPLKVNGIEIAIEHAALLHTGKVLFMSDEPYTLLWDPSDETSPHFDLLPNSATGLTANLVCSGHSFLSDGQLLMAGGGGLAAANALSDAWKFHPIDLKWKRTRSSMANKRWYPTCITLGDKSGRVLVAGGISSVLPRNMEIYDETTDSFLPVTLSRPGEKLFPQTYPGLNLLPGGQIFYTPVGFGDCRQIPNPFGQTEPSGYFKFTGPNAGQWIDTGVNIRTKGMQVILLQTSSPSVRILVVGGGDAAQSKTAQMISPIDPTPKWSPPYSLLEARIHPNVVLLPDNTVFICGGLTDQGPPLRGGRCELYDPSNNTVSEMAALNYPRHYHSIALLLPNGKVLAAGGSGDAGCGESLNNPIEVYSPPYLSKGPRPIIDNSPATVSLGSSFEIETPSAASISSVVLMRPMAVTHQTDTEQRRVPLFFSRPTYTKIKVTAPDGKPPIGALPRGYYMIFILNNLGVPSEARFILFS
jgi:hypothetical protein